MSTENILDRPIQNTQKISPLYLKRLQKVGVFSLRDLFYYFPTRYIDFSKVIPINQLKLDEPATVSGKIFDIKNNRAWYKKINITQAVLQDKTGFLKVVWFNQPFITKNLTKGDIVNLAGKLSYKNKESLFSNPAYEKLTDKQINTGRLVPVYKETKGLTSRWLRFFIKKNLDTFLEEIKENLNKDILNEQKLDSIKESLLQIHFPDSQKKLQQAQKRFAFEELFLIQLFSLKQKLNNQEQKAVSIEFDEDLTKKFVVSLPFKLTTAQRKSAWEILKDIEKGIPMNRLLEGDVGSGKTVVAAISMLQAAKNGFQAALMAPTEILAQQHYKTLSDSFSGQKLSMALLTSKTVKVGRKIVTRKEILEKILQGKIKIIVGTHALIQKNVQFKNLALVIVDEQHRFGVTQRAAFVKNINSLKDGLEKTIPHFLSMTATPIPRTLALTIYGDLDISLLDQAPKNREIIKTFVIPPSKRDGAYKFIAKEVKQGRQAFVICPRIEKSETTENSKDKRKTAWQEVKAVTQEHEKLNTKIFPQLKIDMLHGKMKAPEKEKIMENFKKGKSDILVSTSVIEVGIDIPNATIMMIENADRFGLAQLHQFRGRVGRGQHQSFCFLFSDSKQPETIKRLRALTQAKNGFELSEIDLEIRGPGEFLGAKQSGLPDLLMASLTNIEMIKQARAQAQKTLRQDPDLESLPQLKSQIKNLENNVHRE